MICRMEYTEAEQTLLFFAGANSVFTGDTLLTTANPEVGTFLFTLFYIHLCITSVSAILII